MPMKDAPFGGGPPPPHLDQVLRHAFLVTNDLTGDALAENNGPVSPFSNTKRLGARVRRMVSGPLKPPDLNSLVEELRERAADVEEDRIAERIAVHDFATRVFFVNLGEGKAARIPPDLDAQVALVTRREIPGALLVDEVDFECLEWTELARVPLHEEHLLPALHDALLKHLPPPEEGGLTEAELKAVIAAAWFSIFLRPYAKARPILALVGPHGCGKTTVAELIGLLLYGKGYAVSGGASGSRMVKDLAAGLWSKALLARDDMNQGSTEIIDLLCRAATGTIIELATLYETLGLSRFMCRASVILTAIQPRWALRVDILSRLLVARLRKPPETDVTVEERKARVLKLRNAVWVETLLALRAVYADETKQIPITRFGDWENAVRRILRRAGMAADFDSALRKMDVERQAIAMAADPFLGMLLAFASQPDVAETWFTAAELVDALGEFAGVMPQRRDGHRTGSAVRDPRKLAKTLSHIERTGSSVVIVERSIVKAHNNMLRWRIRPRG